MELSQRLNIALPNVYIYLNELYYTDELVEKSNGKYRIKRTNKKIEQLLAIQAMVPNEFHRLITIDFKFVLESLCKKLRIDQASLLESEIWRIEKIAIPRRIVLRISKKPAVYSLKINEALVNMLLEYHDLKPNFNELDFQNMIEGLNPKKSPEASETVKSESEIIIRCDKLYENGEDDLVSKLNEPVPDERIVELLRIADRTNKEYKLFLNALDKDTRSTMVDQWEKRYIYNTNRIEGNTMSEDEVEEFLKTKKEPSHVSAKEIHETNNTLEAIQFLKLKIREEVSEDLAKELHFMIQKKIAKKPEDPGNYKNFYNHIGGSPTTPPQYVKQRMGMLFDWYQKNKDRVHPFILASIFHMQFEIIHPFPDGNGRVGRLLMNHILMKKDYVPLTILEKTKQNYYRALENRSLPQFLFYTLSGFIEEYKR